MGKKMRALFILLFGAAALPNHVFAAQIRASDHPDFADANSVLRALVGELAKKIENHLYVGTVEKGPGYEHAWVYWKEERLLILWEPFDAKHWKLKYSRRMLRLDKDVVPTVEDIGGSTYLVDEDWACRTIGDCLKNGDEYVIRK
jgi:hypothetical protein